MAVPRAGTPRPVDDLGLAHLRQCEALPLPAHTALAAQPFELKGERLLRSTGMAEDDRTDRARMALVHADDGLQLPHRLLEKTVGRARHCTLLTLPERQWRVPRLRLQAAPALCF